MRIKKVKKATSLKQNDIILVSIESQQDAGVYSDIVEPNVLAIVQTVTKKDNNNVNVLVNGGYEYVFNKKEKIFYIGDYEELSEDANFISDAIEVFCKDSENLKNVNSLIKQINK